MTAAVEPSFEGIFDDATKGQEFVNNLNGLATTRGMDCFSDVKGEKFVNNTRLELQFQFKNRSILCEAASMYQVAKTENFQIEVSNIPK